MGEQVITMPVVALRGLTILPGMVLHFDINRPKSVAAVERAMVGDQKLFLVAQRHPEIVEPEQGDLFQVGTVAVVKQAGESCRARWYVCWWKDWNALSFYAWKLRNRL